ncbi:MAG: hypothetical protein ACO1OQ_10675 [Rufibacter sp.]
MKKYYLLIISLLHILSISAQTIDFEILDSVSIDISQLQKQTNGKSYKDLNGEVYEISFPEENFTVWFKDQLASHAVYKKKDGKEFLALTENIDFSKATGISIADDYNDVTYVKIDFPKGHLKTQILEDGRVTNTIAVNYLQFFCRHGTLNTDKVFQFDRMFEHLFMLAASLKIEKGLAEYENMIKEWNDWSKISSEAFLLKYPKSLLAAQARQIIDNKKREKELKLKNSQDYVLAFAERYKFKPGIPLSEFADLDTKNKDISNKKEKVFSDNGNKYSRRLNEHFFTVETGPYWIETDINNTVIYLEYIVAKNSYTKNSIKLYEVVQELKSNVDKEYIKEFLTGYDHEKRTGVEVNVPGTNLKIATHLSNSFSIVFKCEAKPETIESK